MTNESPWSCLERLAGSGAVLSVWRRELGEHFDGFGKAFLQRAKDPALAFPCPRGCGCAHEIVRHGPEDIVAVCRCDPWRCDDLPLTAADLVVWEINWSRLGRALCQALGLDVRRGDLELGNTPQIGSWSADAVPALLAVQSEARAFRHTVAQLATRLRRRFILLAPTSRFLEATCLETLNAISAEFFALDQHVRVNRDGRLEAIQAPGELFAAFSPRTPVQEDAAQRAFALVKTLDAGCHLRKAPLLKVFRLYCIEALSANEVARRCHCARALVFDRLKLLRQKTGLSPTNFRRYSAQFEKVSEAMSDPRARRIYRKGAIYGDGEDSDA